MHQLCDFGNIVFKQAQRVGVGHHHTCDGVVEQWFQIIHIHAAIGFALHFHHIEPAHGSAGRVGAVCAVGNDDFGALGIAAAFVIATNHHQSGEFAVCTGKRIKREFAHSGNLRQAALQMIVHRQSTLHGFHILQRVQAGELWKSRHFIVDFRIILHGARAQGIESGVHAEIIVAHIGVVTHHREFVHFRQRRRFLAQQVCRQRRRGIFTQFVFGKGIALTPRFR